MSQIIYQVDSFTDRPFSGNPAGVCVLDEPVSDRWMRDVAREMNLSETAFLRRREVSNEYDLRWFTPTVEVDLCGHATLAAAHVLWNHEAHPSESLRFFTRSGWLSARRVADAIELDFPAKIVMPIPESSPLAEALGASILWQGGNGMDILVEVATEAEVRSLKPDFTRLRTIPVRGVIVTSPSDDARFDFVSRFFAPAAGVDEDPVTGSAHCALGPFWAERLGKLSLVGFQASERGGIVGVKLAGHRVILSGSAITVLRCELLHSPSC